MSLQENILASDTAFRAQFDPNSETHHGGSSVPVAVGGSRVPVGMEQELPAEGTSTPTQTNYGPEYTRVEKLRNDIGELKKVMSNINAPVEAIMRFKEQSKSTTAEEEKRDKILSQLEEFKALLAGSEFENRIEAIDEVVKAAKVEIMNKDEQFAFATLVKKHTSQLFRDQKTLLDKMKQLKKQ